MNYSLDFMNWYADCVAYCANNGIGPDDYEWSFPNREAWKKMFDLGYTCPDACGAYFHSN